MTSLSWKASPPRTAPVVGLVQWFRQGDYARVEQVLADARALGVTHLRTGLSWAEWCTPAGEDWVNWLVPTLSAAVSLLPCLHYTPPSLGLEPRPSAPPRDPAGYAAFVRCMIDRFPGAFEAVELWNEPNNPADWDAALDSDGRIFARMVTEAAEAAHLAGVRTVLGGMCPIDPEWLERMCDFGVLDHIDAVGVHGFPGTWDFDWAEWPQRIADVRRVLEANDLRREIWITEAGYSTWRDDEHGQVRAFLKAQQAPVERLYWTSVLDLDPEQAHRDGWHADERHYHLGLRTVPGPAKLLYHLWSRGGLAALHQAGWLHASPLVARGIRPVLITGGAGFIGSNVADRLLSSGQRVVILDNLSRTGVERNLHWLRARHGDRLQIEVGDVRDASVVRRLVRSARHVYHFAAQVAVTLSLQNALADFDVNARGTLNLLEAARAAPDPPSLLFTSTNKVYGGLADLLLRQVGGRYVPEDPEIAGNGIDERRPLQFQSPYGCSKGAADQYVLDYAHTFDLPCVVFRMSCIYGPHQFGTEDQGWVAHFLLKSHLREPIVIYGDGMQVRDVLYVDDLVDAMLAAHAHISETAGQAFNMGGGPSHAISLLELLDAMSRLHGQSVSTRFEAWRPGDQRYYVSNTARLQSLTGWTARTPIADGLKQLSAWLRGSLDDDAAAPAPVRQPLVVRAS
jgi:CDP-paratose 2-epimerase